MEPPLPNNFETLFAGISSQNIIFLLIIACSIVSFALFFERLFCLKSLRNGFESFIQGIQNALEMKDLSEAIKICDKKEGSFSSVIKAGLLKANKEKEVIEQAMELQARIEIASLEKNTKILSLVAHIAPLIGLLGTVIGFIQAFSEMRLSGLVDIDATKIGEALEFALITTAAGLAVAIPTTLAYHYLVARIENLVLELEATSSEVVNIMLENQ